MEQIEYTRTVVPSSMRSPYWKYFGFPSDNGNNILTRQKIVCTICNTAIAYNKNTSNLRTHLMSKHVDIFQKIISSSNGALITEDINNFREHVEGGVRLVTAPVNNIVTITKLKRRRSEQPKEFIADDLQTKNVFNVNPQLPESYLDITEFKPNMGSPNITTTEVISSPQDLNPQQLEIRSTGYPSFDDLNDSEIVEVTESAESEDQLPDTLNPTTQVEQSSQQQPFTYVDVIQPMEIHQSNSLENMLADMIQVDLLTLDILQSQGFCKYNQQLTGLRLDCQTLPRVTDLLRQRFINTQQLINNHLRQLSQIAAYSLSIEYYKDNNNQDILNIYFNYLNDGQTELNSILYYSGSICKDNANTLEDLLKDIYLKNCCGIVVPDINNCENLTQEFAKCHDIDIIECLEAMLSRCLNQIFDMDEFSTGFERLCNLFEKKTWLLKPTFKPGCCWSKLNYLEYIYNNLEQNEAEMFVNIKQIFDHVKPLKMALDIVTDEPLALCTLTRPLIIKLFEEHFSFLKKRETYVLTAVQEILEKELKERVLSSNFLNEATFFDARFHRDFALEESAFDINLLKSKVCERFKDDLDVSYITKSTNVKTEEKSSSLLMNSKKSSLKTFFKRDSNLPDTTIPLNLKTNLDIEFENYQNESCLELDQNPVLWWQQQLTNYKQLYKIAKHYLTIPCCSVPRLCRLDVEQRYLKLERRKHLNQYCNIERNLWYLYYNDLTETDIKF